MAPTHNLWRETPLTESAPLSKAAGCRVYLKLENLQPSGSFKSRGIGNYILSHLKEHPENEQPHFYSSSGGNAGLACVVAARSLDYPATVVVPTTTKPLMITNIKTAGASAVIQEGASWKEADEYLRNVVLKEDKNGVYVPPFDHANIWTGNSTIVSEIRNQLNNTSGGALNGDVSNGTHQEIRPDAIICSIGGGGLFSGIMEGLDLLGWSSVPVLAVETDGAASLRLSLDRGTLSTLPAITSLATSLGATRVASKAYEYAKRPNVHSCVLSDAEAAMGCWRLADDHRIMVELACGVNVALCYENELEEALGKKLTKDSRVVVIICGGSNVTSQMLVDWREKFGCIESSIVVQDVPSSLTAPEAEV